MDVLIRKKSTRSRTAPFARFCILHSYGRTARDLRHRQKSHPIDPSTTIERPGTRGFDSDDWVLLALVRRRRTPRVAEKSAWRSLAPIPRDSTTIRTI